MKHANIAVFIPHAGCPQQCCFCNQHCITGAAAQPEYPEVRSAVEIAAASLKEKTAGAQLAFFGGSFTAIDSAYMLRLLEAGAALTKEFGLSGIRVSTRPDAITPEILTCLKDHGVQAVELGAQSMNDRVLALNRRGHTAEAVQNASRLIKKADLELGLQMMTGLYGSDDETDYLTAVEITKLSPATVRIYPTVVLEGTALCHLYREGRYIPETLPEAVGLCARLISLFEGGNVRVIRAGLHASDHLEGRVAGPYHPAFMELCRSAIFLERIFLHLRQKNCRVCTVLVSPQKLSQALGQKRENIRRLAEAGFTVAILADPALVRDEVQIIEGEAIHAPEIPGNTRF